MMLFGKRLVVGFSLILLATGILLATDRSRVANESKTGPRVWRIALLQHASIPALDDGTAGAIDGLAAQGFREGENIEVTRYNAHGNVGTAGTIAREIVNGDFDLLITISTPSLQVVANANKDRRNRHVFGLVADPFSAGVGIDRADPAKHPPYLVGQGIFLPVEESFRLARRMNPGLKKVGVVWNPSESNSQAFTTKGREVCQAMGINLVEATTDNSAGVLQATNAVLARGVEAIWVGGDVTVSVAIDSVIASARKAGIPVFSIVPAKADRGTLFDVGINFYECGKMTGALAAQVLQGTDPATIPIRDVMDIVPKRLIVNQLALKDLREPWTVPEELLQQADIVVDEKGIREKK